MTPTLMGIRTYIIDMSSYDGFGSWANSASISDVYPRRRDFKQLDENTLALFLTYFEEILMLGVD